MFYLRDVNVEIIVMAIGNRSFHNVRFYTRSLLNHVVSIISSVLVISLDEFQKTFSCLFNYNFTTHKFSYVNMFLFANAITKCSLFLWCLENTFHCTFCQRPHLHILFYIQFHNSNRSVDTTIPEFQQNIKKL